MIAYILIGVGILLSLFAIIGFIRILLLPLRKMHQVVFHWEDDVLKYRDGAGRLEYQSRLRELIVVYICCLLVGISSFFLGIYLGYAEKGDSFWFYEKVFGPEEKENQWEQITEDNKFKAKDGNTYSFYLIVEGDSFIFCGEKCSDADSLRERLDSIRRENTVILIDSYAVAGFFNDAEKLLKQMGIKYETEEE